MKQKTTYHGLIGNLEEQKTCSLHPLNFPSHNNCSDQKYMQRVQSYKPMTIFFILSTLFLLSCTISQKIVYKTNDLNVPQNVQTIPAIVEVRIFEDNRGKLEENLVLFNNPRQIKINGKLTCINSEIHYQKDTVSAQISRMLVEHFNKSQLFTNSYYKEGHNSNYYLTGSLNSFYAEQEFSTAAAVGASFGLIGALATAGIKTPGKIIIDISDLKLYTKDNTLVKDLGSFYKEYKDDFPADANCWCVYWNSNDKLKDFNSFLVEKIRSALIETDL